jgi:cell division transport system permease protein
MNSRFLLSESWRSMRVNASTSLAAIVTVVIGTVLVGLLLALGSWILSWSNHLERELVVDIYFDASASPTQWNATAEFVQAHSAVKSVKFVSKKAALAYEKRAYPTLVKNVLGNPLPNKLLVTPVHAKDTAVIAHAVTSARLPGVRNVSYGAATAERILTVAKTIEIVFLVAVLVILGAAVLLIGNTIRLSIYSRRKEIEVMKLVGASDWFIRGPFILEGVFCGLVGALAAVVLLFLGKVLLLPTIAGGALASPDVHALPFALNVAAILGIGLTVGASGSGLTMRRFLRV